MKEKKKFYPVQAVMGVNCYMDYNIKWKGYKISENTEEPQRNLVGITSQILKFFRRRLKSLKLQKYFPQLLHPNRKVKDKEDSVPKKRGRPFGSLNKNKPISKNTQKIRSRPTKNQSVKKKMVQKQKKKRRRQRFKLTYRPQLNKKNRKQQQKDRHKKRIIIKERIQRGREGDFFDIIKRQKTKQLIRKTHQIKKQPRITHRKRQATDNMQKSLIHGGSMRQRLIQRKKRQQKLKKEEQQRQQRRLRQLLIEEQEDEGIEQIIMTNKKLKEVVPIYRQGTISAFKIPLRQKGMNKSFTISVQQIKKINPGYVIGFYKLYIF